MADLCGPSNPVQKFQNHTSADRSLHHDRLIAAHAPAEQFRSPPGPDVKLVEAEFEAFENSRPPDPSYIDSPFFQDYTSRPAHASQTTQSDWASDFQDLKLHEAPYAPIPSSQLHHHAPLERKVRDPWHQEFLRSNRSAASHGSTTQQLPHHAQWPSSPLSHLNTQLPVSSQALSQEPALQQPFRVDGSQFIDDKVFAEAFEKAEQEARFRDQLKEVTPTQVAPGSTTVQRPDSPQYRIGSDRISEGGKAQADGSADGEEADALARTAGSLLETVKHDTSTKFQESNFLSLMRQLRDREVKVDGDKIVETAQALHPGGVNYPPQSDTGERYGDVNGLIGVSTAQA